MAGMQALQKSVVAAVPAVTVKLSTALDALVTVWKLTETEGPEGH
jgi:hypothetical protein